MEVKFFVEGDISSHGKKGAGKVYIAHVVITDVKAAAAEMIEIVKDTTWIDKLDAISEETFRARSARTITKLVDDIFAKVEDSVTVEFGEYLVSVSAQRALEGKRKHVVFPLAEILKEKVTGNPGFDFHTESEVKQLCFGEAKYSASINPYTKALKQICDFIELKKDSAELADISKFATEDAPKNFLINKKGYTAAFSVNSADVLPIMNNALKCIHIGSLLDFPEIFLIGVEINDK